MSQTTNNYDCSMLSAELKNNSSFITHNSSFAEDAMSQTLYAQMEESAQLDDVIRQNLKGLGYGA